MDELGGSNTNCYVRIVFVHRKFLGNDSTSEFDDVLRSVHYILESRRGSAWFRDDFGLGVEGCNTQEQFVSVLSRQIRETLTRYEPRLEILDIGEQHDRNGQVKLVVRCRVPGDDRTIVVSQKPGEHARVASAR